MIGRLILVGASGTIGAATLECAYSHRIKVVPTFHSRPISGGVLFQLETDTLDSLAIQYDDSLIIFAAYSDQEWIRKNPDQARKLNIDATARISREAYRAGAWIVFLSSEAVFGENLDGGWSESDLPCPVTEYGRQKREMELILEEQGNASIVRTGWNVSDRLTDRCIIKNTYQSLLSGDARLAEDNLLSLTHVRDTAELLVNVATERINGYVHSVSGIPITRTALADEIIKNSSHGKDMRYERIKFAQLQLSEPKPARAWLRSSAKVCRRTAFFETPQKIIANKIRALEDFVANK
jgi:dTDP-4-dehydrorhamnose reductase